MINLPNTQFGQKRRLIIGGLNSFDVFSKSLNVIFYVQIVDNNGDLINDVNIAQNRRVVYNVNNENFVNAQFDPVDQNHPKSKKEYDYFFELMRTIPLPNLIIQLAQKLIIRGLFD